MNATAQYFQEKADSEWLFTTVGFKCEVLNLKKNTLSCPSTKLSPEKCKHCRAIKTLFSLFNQPSTATLAPPMVRVWDGSICFVTNGRVAFFASLFFWLNYTPLMTCQFKCGKPCSDGPVVCVCQHNLSVSIVSRASHTWFHSHSLWQKKRERRLE